MRKVFGIPSWLPDKEPDRTMRKERLNRLFKQLERLWPDVDILVIAQNWQDFSPVDTKNKQVIRRFEPLGILKARKALREEFLALGYDYLIMFDDDAIIKCENDHAHLDFMTEIDRHPNGFCFVHGRNNKYHPYIGAQLNLCAVSRFIYEKEPMVDIDPQKDEGYEDSIFACLLHHKWGRYEFTPPDTIKPVQFMNSGERVPSTWADQGLRRPFAVMQRNTNRIQEYICKHKEFPAEYKSMIDKYEQPDYNVYSNSDTYMGF